MNIQMNQQSQISIADKLLQQLQDEYLAIQAQNIIMPKQNIQPEDDPQNPYQTLDYDDNQDEQAYNEQNYGEDRQNNQENQYRIHQQNNNCQTFDNDQKYFESQILQGQSLQQQKYQEQNQKVQCKECQEKQQSDQEQQKKHNIQSQLSNINLKKEDTMNNYQPQQSNPQIKQQLMQVQPTSQDIYNIPHKEFQIDESKIKKFALQMQINQPQWLKDTNLCQKRIQQLFVRPKNLKPFKKL